MWARASLFCRFMDTNIYTEPVPLKYGKLATKISVEVSKILTFLTWAASLFHTSCICISLLVNSNNLFRKLSLTAEFVAVCILQRVMIYKPRIDSLLVIFASIVPVFRLSRATFIGEKSS